MKRIHRNSFLATVAALALVACQPAEERVDEWTDDNAAVEAEAPSPEMRAQLEAFRADVDSVLSELRSEIEEMREGLREEDTDRWTQVSTRVEETRGDVLEDMDRLETADEDEARRIRDRASERIAELEADVVRSDLELTRDAQTFAQKMDEHLTELESDLAELGAHAAQRPEDVDRRDDGDPDPDAAERIRDAVDWTGELDEQEIENLREELIELREEMARVPERAAEDNGFESVRDDLSGRVGDLTEDIKRHWYAMKWDAKERDENRW
jgi:hypothetical protein